MKQIKKMVYFFKEHNIFITFASLILSLLFSSILIFLSGYSPIEAYQAMFEGAFGNIYNLAATLGTATPLIFAGLAMAISAKAGVFNIGGEGQIIIGALVAAVLGRYIQGIPWFVHIPLCLLGAALAGGLWAEIAAVLKVKMNINEVIVTIMLNYVALYLVEFLVKNIFKAEGMTARTDYIMNSAVIPSIIKNTRLNYGIFLALFIAILFWIVLQKTVFGYELRSVGLNQLASETAGIKDGKYICAAMFISGAIAGLGGAVVVMGIHKYYISGITTNYGYDGIAVAVMGANSPIGTVLTAFIFGALKAGSASMNRMTNIPSEFISVLQALVIIFVATPTIVRKIIAPFMVIGKYKKSVEGKD